MMTDYPELSAKIGSKNYGFKHITKIIAQYNEFMIENGEEVVLGMN